MNQRQRIIDYIRQFGSITSKEAYNDLGITQLATRIKELKELGYEFETKWESSKNRFGESVSFKRYYLMDMITKNMNHIPRLDQLMKQIKKNTLCYYCLGCNKQESEEYKSVMRCKSFTAAIENWQEKLREELKRSEQIQK